MNPASLAIIAVAVGVFAFLTRRRGVGAATIKSPRITFLNLKGTAGEQILAEDKSAVASMFSTIQESSTTPPPPCDVLFIYCDIDPNGRIAGTAALARLHSPDRDQVDVDLLAPNRFWRSPQRLRT